MEGITGSCRCPNVLAFYYAMCHDMYFCTHCCWDSMSLVHCRILDAAVLTLSCKKRFEPPISAGLLEDRRQSVFHEVKRGKISPVRTFTQFIKFSGIVSADAGSTVEYVLCSKTGGRAKRLLFNSLDYTAHSHTDTQLHSVCLKTGRVK